MVFYCNDYKLSTFSLLMESGIPSILKDGVTGKQLSCHRASSAVQRWL